MPIPQERVIASQVQYCINGNRLSTTFHYGFPSGSPADPIDHVGTYVANTLVPLIAACVSQDVVFQKVYTWCIKPNTYNPDARSYDNEVGLIALDSVPSNIAAVINLYQEEEPGSHNGRVFISGVSEGDVTDALITTASITAHWDDLVTACHTQFVTSGVTYHPVVVQRIQGGIEIVPEGHVVVTAALNRALGTQRRRKTELRSIHP